MMVDSYLSVNLWTLFFLLKYVITEHTIPYEVYLFVDIFCPNCTRTRVPHLYGVNILFMTMAQSREDISSTIGPLVVRFYVNFP